MMPKARQHEDVHLRVSEDPEQVLPEQRISSGLDAEERGAETSLEHQQEERHGDDGDGEQEQHLHHEGHPGEDRHLHHRHARCPHVEHRDDEVDGTDQRGDTSDLQAECPEVDTVGRAERHRTVRCVHEPAAVCAAAEEPRRVEEDATKDEDPEGQRVEARERDVSRTDLKRDEVVREGRSHRHHEEEHHGGGVHREHLVVLVGRQDGAVRTGELQPDESGFKATDDEEEHRDGAVHDADFLVIDREGPRAPARGFHGAAQVAVVRGSSGRWRRSRGRASVVSAGRSMMAIVQSLRVTCARAGRR